MVSRIRDDLQLSPNHHSIIVDYPFTNSVFPPDMVAPTFKWHDGSPATLWLVKVGVPGNGFFYRLTEGKQAEKVIDPDAISDANRNYRPTAYEESTKEWKIDEQLWNYIKSSPIGENVQVNLYGLSGTAHEKCVSFGAVSLSISPDPVEAPIFYRDVPLMPSMNSSGKISPLSKNALPLMAWRLRDLSKPEAPVILKNMPTCANCHSFSTDGKVLGMDMDGPNGDKGAYGIVDVEKEIVIENEDIITWNSYKDTPEGHLNFGLFSQVSPNGRYVVSTLNEDTFVANYTNISFLQSFYPTRGILVVYDRVKNRMFPLPGASDPRFVQTNATWSPDGKELVFSRALARDAFENMELPTFAGDDREPDLQYDLYRIPFNAGRGGKAVPLEGASGNGKSNSFPKYSPNGKWIVYVQASRGQLMRPDSRLFIIPSSGGAAREMNCNLNSMNSWHSWSPNSKWLVFSSKGMGPFTKMFLTHIDENGIDSPAILIPDSTAANRAVNIPEFINGPGDAIESISAPSQKSYELFMKSGILDGQDKLEEALEAINRSLELNPYYAHGHHHKGFILYRMGQKAEALRCFKMANKFDPELEMAFDAVVHILTEEQRIDDAITYMAGILEKVPKHPDANKLIAELYQKKGERLLAIKHNVIATESRRYPPDFYGHIGARLYELGAYDEALQCYKRALEISPDHPEVIYGSGMCHQKKGNIEEAVKLFNKAINLDDGSGAHYDLAIIAMNKNRLESSVYHFKKFLAKRPDIVVARRKLAAVYLSRNEIRKGVEQYEIILGLDPANLNAMLLLTQIYATSMDQNLAQPERAVMLAEKACELTKYNSPPHLDSLAVSYAAVGRYQDAVATAEKALQQMVYYDNPALLQLINEHLALFKAKQPIVPVPQGK